MKRLIALLVIFCFFSSFSKAQESIRVAVAANLIFPIQAVRETFEKQYPNISIEIITASSGKLAAQIKNSAPFHIFIAADIFYPQNLFDNKFAKEVPQIITYGNLVLWTKHPITEKKTVGFLNEALNKTIAIAQPEIAPYGQNAKVWLQQNKLWHKLKEKIVYGESIGKINQYIFSGSVDVAFTANSAMYSKPLKNKGNWTLLAGWKGIPHGGMVLNYGLENQREASSTFFRFLSSEQAQEIFKRFGYQTKIN